ncbi:MAG: hypothetical protein ACKO54_16185, partial [Alphaproteobacteria bacterium]
MILSIARNQGVTAVVTEKPLVSANSSEQKVVAKASLEFLHGAFATNQGIGATRIIAVKASIIAVKILKHRVGRRDVD